MKIMLQHQARLAYIALLAVLLFAPLAISPSVSADTVRVFDDEKTFLAETGAMQIEIPTVESHPCPESNSKGPGVGCAGGPPNGTTLTIPFGTNNLTISGSTAPLRIFEKKVTGQPHTIDPAPNSPTLVYDGADNFVLTFATPVKAVGIRLIRNAFADETVFQMLDASGKDINFFSIRFKHKGNEVGFIGFSSATPIKSLRLNTTGGETQNEGISGLWASR